jgi:hypothetical protein
LEYGSHRRDVDDEVAAGHGVSILHAGGDIDALSRHTVVRVHEPRT